MNIWYLSAHDQPRGQSARTYEFSSELVKLGHTVTMFTNGYCHWTHKEYLKPHEAWRIEHIDGIRVAWLKTTPYKGNGFSRGANMVSNARRCLQVSKVLEDKPDVVIGPSVPLGTGWAALKIAKRKGAAFVFEIRDVWPTALVDDGGLSKRNPLYFAFRYLEKLLYRNADRISATMPFVFNHVAQSGGDPGKVSWIPNGVNFDRFRGYNEYDGGRQDQLTIMYVGGFGAAHDVITIVKAAHILKQNEINNIRFVIIGNGPKKAECLNYVADNRLETVEFRDPIPKAEIPIVQQESDVLIAAVLNSPIYRFGLNLNKMFDYFASARPVIFSGKAPNDPVIDAGAGFSIPPENPQAMADSILEFLKMSPDQRKAMGMRGRKYIEDYKMAQLGLRMEALLLDAVHERECK